MLVPSLIHSKGGEGAPSPLGFQCGSALYWLVTLSAIPWVAGFFVYIRRWVLRDYATKVRLTRACVCVCNAGGRAGGRACVGEPMKSM